MQTTQGFPSYRSKANKKMHSNDEIVHTATVQEITPDWIVVVVQQTSACLHCTAGKFCSAADSRTRRVHVPNDGRNSFDIGEQVLLRGSATMGLRATWWAFLVPLILLTSALLIFSRVLHWPDGISALASLLILLLYGLFLWLRRRKMSTSFLFHIEKQSSL